MPAAGPSPIVSRPTACRCWPPRTARAAFPASRLAAVGALHWTLHELAQQVYFTNTTPAGTRPGGALPRG